MTPIKIDQNAATLETSPAFEPITGVELIVGTDKNGNEHKYIAGQLKTVMLPRGRLRGDANGDGYITDDENGDTEYITDLTTGRIPMPETGSEDFKACDVNNDGSINSLDLLLVSDICLGQIKSGAFAEITGNWSNNPDYETDEAQFYVDIPLNAQEILSFSGDSWCEENIVRCELVNGILRVWVKLVPLTAKELSIRVIGSGRTLMAKCPWATQAMADNLLAEISGYAYQPYAATDALLDPAAELGDAVRVGGVVSLLGSIETAFDALYTANIEAPQDEEIDHEYPYEPQPERTAARKAATVTAELSVLADTISSKISSADAQTLITQNLDSITLSASAGSNQSTVTISAGGIVVDSAIVRFSNIVADSIVANASIVAPTIYASGQNEYLQATSDGIVFKGKSGGSWLTDWEIKELSGGAVAFRSELHTIGISSVNFLKLSSGAGLVLDSSMHGTFTDRNALTPTAGRIFFVRA